MERPDISRQMMTGRVESFRKGTLPPPVPGFEPDPPKEEKDDGRAKKRGSRLSVAAEKKPKSDPKVRARRDRGSEGR